MAFEFDAEYSILDAQGAKAESGKGKVGLNEETLTLSPGRGACVLFAWRDIESIKAAEYKATVTSLSGDKIELSALGYKYEDFLRIASGFRNESLIKDLLMNEPLKVSQIEAHCARLSLRGEKLSEGQCELRVYETALMVLPERDELIRAPFRDIKDVRDGELSVTVELESGEKLEFSKLGNKLDYFKTNLSDAMDRITAMGAEFLKSVVPGTSGLALRKLSRTLKEGRLMPLAELESLCPGFGKGLEAAVCADPGIKKEYLLLKGLSRTQKIQLGFKKALAGGLAGDYLLFLFPVYCADPKQPGNAVIMEAFPMGPAEKPAQAAGARATYFFKLAARKDYALSKSLAELDELMDVFAWFFNTAMGAVNFRRTPLLLSEARLLEPKYAVYRAAAARIPELKALRGLYLGRTIHTDFESWSENTCKLLAFNVKTAEEAASLKGLFDDGAVPEEEAAAMEE